MGQRIAKRVLLIGWDAADWDIIRPLAARGQMPNFKRFIDEGATGNIATLNPILSPILWNSIATGKRADKHDILGFMEPDGQGFIRPVSSTSRRAKAIWNILSQRGMTSHVVGWYASYPAEKIRGSVVTDRYEAFVEKPDLFADDPNAYHPADLKDDLRSLHVSKHDIVRDQVAPFIPMVDTIDTTTDPYVGIFAHTLAQCASVHNAATIAVERDDWDFCAVYYTAIDHFGHEFQEFHPPRMAHVPVEFFDKYKHVITSVYQYHDMMLGRLMQLAGPETTVIVLSDHGFKNGADRPLIFIDPQTGKRSGPGINPVQWHRPFGVIAAVGPGIARGVEVRGSTLLDICPTILTLLGVPVGQDMDGRVIEPVFATRPRVDTIATHEESHPDDGVFRGESVDDPYAAQEVLKQLVELGYMEAPDEDKQKTVERIVRERRDALATVLTSAGRVQEAVKVLEELFTEHPTPYRRHRLGTALGMLGRFDEVTALMDGAAETPEDAPIMNTLRAQVAMSRGQTDVALDLLERVLKASPGMPRVRTLMARPLMKHGDNERAERVLREALEIQPDDPEALNLLGVVLRRTGRLEDAVHAHMKSVTLLHEQPVAHFNLGEVLRELGQHEWAKRAYEVCLELRPSNALAHRRLAELYHAVFKDSERAAYHKAQWQRSHDDRRDAMFEAQLDLDRW
jgi:predicted AlkP superfamily phosphohydrolase/phosphomutase/Flp pilus assembly protein TadD